MEDLLSPRGVVKFGIRAQRLVALVFAVVLVSLGLFSPPAAAAADSIEIRRNLPLLLQTLDSLPYSKEGKGPVIYVIEFSTCGVARRFETEYGARLAGMGFEVRRIYYGVDVATQNNAAASALSRDPAMQRAFMFNNRRAPSVYDTSAALAAYQDVPDKLNKCSGCRSAAERLAHRQGGLAHAGWNDGNTTIQVSPVNESHRWAC